MKPTFTCFRNHHDVKDGQMGYHQRKDLNWHVMKVTQRRSMVYVVDGLC